MNKDGFFFEVQRLAFELEKLIDEYGVRDQVVNLMVTGLIERTPDGVSKLRALFSYSIQDAEELDELIDFVYNTWQPEDDDDIDLTDLLDGLGIDLE